MDTSNWYDSDPDALELLQGDVVESIPVVFGPPTTKRWIILRPTPAGTPIEQAESGLPRMFRADVAEKYSSAWSKPDELVLAWARVSRIMIVSQSCDLDWRKNVQVAPVESASAISGETLVQLRSNNVGYWFYLPAAENIGECYADLSRITSVHATYFRPDALVKRLTSSARIELQNCLADFYGRAFGFNITDRVPQNAEYRCIRCFSRGAEAPQQTLTVEIGNFPPCAKCGDQGLWIKISA